MRYEFDIEYLRKVLDSWRMVVEKGFMDPTCGVEIFIKFIEDHEIKEEELKIIPGKFYMNRGGQKVFCHKETETGFEIIMSEFRILVKHEVFKDGKSMKRAVHMFDIIEEWEED